MTRTVQLLEASTAYQIMVLAAAIDSGAFEPADERILLVTVNTPVPEVATRPDETPGIAPLLSRFDRVVSLNDLIAPLHPTAFRPRAGELRLFERLLSAALGIPEDAALELALESVQAPPARTLLTVFASAAVTVYAEGLMSYGPTRSPVPPDAASRIRRVLHLDLVAGLKPLLLAEFGIEARTVDEQAFRDVVAEVAAAAPPAAPTGPYALVLGQYLAQLGLLSRVEEVRLTADLVLAAARDFATIVYKPHPSAPADLVDAVVRAGRKAGTELVVLRDAAPAEALVSVAPPGLVLGCFSTGLVTAARYWGVPAATTGTERVLAALPRFEDSNRVPLALVAWTVPPVDGGAAPADRDALQDLVGALGYAMQWRIDPRARGRAAATMRRHPAAFAHVVPAARRRRLGLPGGWPVAVPSGLFDRAVGTIERVRGVRADVRRVLGGV